MVVFEWFGSLTFQVFQHSNRFIRFRTCVSCFTIDNTEISVFIFWFYLGILKRKIKKTFIFDKRAHQIGISVQIYLTKRRVSVIQDLIESMLIAVQYIQSIWSSHKCTHMKWLDHLKCSNSVHKTSFTIVIFSVFLDIDHIKLLNVL